ncbi:MAG: LPXTG cell wall anchor domain-containing protein [Candidatus Heimdallarchaeota archaeon]|nr:LPXTG cell wall anchor domain-containing protein [Candidatus Heimdallarchaeota archaeon]
MNCCTNKTDGDSHIDSWEVAQGTNPNDSSDYPDEIFETNTEKSPIDFVYVVLSLITLSGLFIFKRRK